MKAAGATSTLDMLDCVVIGAGVVGLACARAFALAGREVTMLEAGPRFGAGLSSRNSEVIHAGLYYPPQSLKATLCMRGRALLYAYCDARHIPYRRCGKLLVAGNAAQRTHLSALAANARACGVDDLQTLDGDAARQLEPALRCEAALLSPSTGIIDSHALMLALLGDAEHAGATLVLETPVLGGRCEPRRPDGDSGIVLETGGVAPCRLRARQVINAAGLGAIPLANRLSGLAPTHVPEAFWAKGSYCTLRGPSPFSRLIYPMPQNGGLGIHLTLDLHGRARFGPDVEWLSVPTLSTSPASPAAVAGVPPDTAYAVTDDAPARFAAAVQAYWPDVAPDRLQPDYAGIRPKIAPPTAVAADFRIDGPELHGIAGLVNLFGIESPGLTASLAIAEHVQTRYG